MHSRFMMCSVSSFTTAALATKQMCDETLVCQIEELAAKEQQENRRTPNFEL